VKGVKSIIAGVFGKSGAQFEKLSNNTNYCRSVFKNRVIIAGAF